MARADGVVAVTLGGEVVGWAIRTRDGNQWGVTVRGFPGAPTAMDVALNEEEAKQTVYNHCGHQDIVWRRNHYEAIEVILDFVIESGGVLTPDGWLHPQADGSWAVQPIV